MQNNPIYCTGCSWGFYPENPLNLRIEVQTICGFEYNAAGTSYSLVQFPFSEGRVLSKGGGLYGYEYLMKDHLGNVRVSFEPADNNNITLTQEDYYYPFELRVPIVDQAASKNRYLYNGKEYVNFENLNWYDYGARWYDPQLGRWHVVDPADQFFSPYVYGNNNPINGVDKHGMFWEEFRNYFSGLGWYKDSELKTIQVLSWVKSGATDVGHMALMTEEGNIYGYYPVDENGNAQYDKGEFFGGAGELDVSTPKQLSEHYESNTEVSIYTIKVNPVQESALKSFYISLKDNPGIYNLLTRQCTSVVLAAFYSAKIAFPKNAIFATPGYVSTMLEWGLIPNVVGKKTIKLGTTSGWK